MPRWVEILLTLALFAMGMTAVGWAIRIAVPPFGDWLSRLIGEGGIWLGLVTLWSVCAYFAWRGHRPTKGNAGRADGR